MTKLLNRGNVFVVVRETDGARPAICGVFSELNEADEYKGMCEQRWKDKVGSLDGIYFDIQMTTYYGK